MTLLKNSSPWPGSEKVELVHEVPGGPADGTIDGDGVPYCVLDNEHPRLFQVLAQALNVKDDESDFPFAAHGFSAAWGAQNQPVGASALLAVHHDEVVGEGVQAVVERAEAEKFSSHLLLQSEQGKMAGNVAGQQKSSKSFSDLLLLLVAGGGWYSVLKVRFRLAQQIRIYQCNSFSRLLPI